MVALAQRRLAPVDGGERTELRQCTAEEKERADGEREGNLGSKKWGERKRRERINKGELVKANCQNLNGLTNMPFIQWFTFNLI